MRKDEDSETVGELVGAGVLVGGGELVPRVFPRERRRLIRHRFLLSLPWPKPSVFPIHICREFDSSLWSFVICFRRQK